MYLTSVIGHLHSNGQAKCIIGTIQRIIAKHLDWKNQLHEFFCNDRYTP